MRNDFFGEMAETGGVPLNASPVRRWAGVFGHRPFAFSISMGIKNVLDDLLSSNYSGSIFVRAKQSTQAEKQAIPTTKAENQNYTHEKETTRVLHPASRLAPENGGIPPFYGCC